ncbi:MAG TPA: type II toxin-antitoxin system VapC family toxin [Steroidobacteraceae bacterium]|nr:type II toxin-antitoxin system VapC family toxin [Steroidobacteraceae bacterium]
MLGLDTNVLVRFLIRDDEAQFERARRLIQRETGRGEAVLISLLVLLETEWVLRSRYGLQKSEIAGVFSSLLDTTELIFEDEASIERALFIWRESSAQFADCMIGARHWALDCRATASFDAVASRLPGFVRI